MGVCHYVTPVDVAEVCPSQKQIKVLLLTVCIWSLL